MRRLASAAAGVAVLVLALPAGAVASTACSYNGAKTILSITASVAGDVAIVSRNPNAPSELVVTGFLAPVPCTGGPATVNQLETVNYVDNSGGVTAFVVSGAAGPIGPGATSEGAFNVSEIEVNATMGVGDGDYVFVGGTSISEGIRIGSPSAGKTGFNLNTHESSDDGDDILVTGAERISLDAGDGNDVVSAQGGMGTGSPVPIETALSGGLGNDSLTGTELANEIDGDEGNDTIVALGGDDEIDGGAGDDAVDGGEGLDAMSYASADVGVRVDLAAAGAQVTNDGSDSLTAIEALAGSSHDDVLLGTDAPEQLSAGSGDDRLEGRGGADVLLGGPGRDAAVYEGAPGPVAVDLVAPAPQVSGAAGADELTDVEDLVGSAFADTLAGTDTSNSIAGGGGADHVSGRGGEDTLRLRDGTADTADCGDALDTVESDAQGTDLLTSCEAVAYAPTPDPDPSGPGEPDPGHEEPAGPGVAPGDKGCLAKRRLTLRLDPRLTRATVTLAGKRVVTRRAEGRLTVRVDLRGRKPGVYRLKVVGRSASGKRIRSTRPLRVC